MSHWSFLKKRVKWSDLLFRKITQKLYRGQVGNSKAEKSQAPWLTSVILATWNVEIRRYVVWGKHRQEVREVPSQLIKSGCGGVHLSSQCRSVIVPVHTRYPSYKGSINWSYNSGWPMHKCKHFLKNIRSQKGWVSDSSGRAPAW
jgi:hypothetical protein